MALKRLTREEWEERQRQEWRESEERARQRGDIRGMFYLSRADLDRQSSREAIESLVEVKLKQLKLSIMDLVDEARNADTAEDA